MVTAQEVVSESIELITLPEVYMRVKSVIEDDNGTIKDLSECLVYDPALSAQILKTANSALWAPRYRIETMCRALEVLGMRHVHDLVLAVTVSSVFKSLDNEHINFLKFWKKSVFTAVLSSLIGKRAELIDFQRPFVEALLSDLGHMLLYMKTPNLAHKAYKLAEGDLLLLASFERDLIGCDYTEVGAALTDLWQLPKCFSDTISNQNHPEKSQGHAFESAILHIATRVTNKVFENESIDLSETIVPSAWLTIGLSADCLPELEASAKTDAEATFNMFF